MEIATEKKTLLGELQKVCPIADRKNPMPILANILIEADTQYVSLSATNLYLSARTRFAAGIKSKGIATVPADTLLDIVKHLPDGKVALMLDPKANVMRIQAKSIKMKVNTLPGKEFPDMPVPPTRGAAKLLADSLSEVLTLTHYAVSQDDASPHLTNLLLECGKSYLRAVGTDKVRISKAEHRINKRETATEFQMSIPIHGALELRRIIDLRQTESDSTFISISTAGPNAFFEYNDFLLSIRLSTEQFPAYAKILPKTFDKMISVPRETFFNALRRISLFSGERHNLVRLSLDKNTLTISGAGAIGEGVEKIKIEYDKAPIEVGFNATYLLDILKAIPEEKVILALNTAFDPGGILRKDFIGIIMPLGK